MNLVIMKKIFDNFTMVPIEKKLINISLLNKKEKDWINSYHKKVFDTLKSHMNEMEFLELKESCSAI